MKINIHSGLPYVEASVTFNSEQLTLKKVIIDTGSSSSIFKADKVSDIGILLEPEDSIVICNSKYFTTNVWIQKANTLRNQ